MVTIKRSPYGFLVVIILKKINEFETSELVLVDFEIKAKLFWFQMF